MLRAPIELGATAAATSLNLLLPADLQPRFSPLAIAGAHFALLANPIAAAASASRHSLCPKPSTMLSTTRYLLRGTKFELSRLRQLSGVLSGGRQQSTVGGSLHPAASPSPHPGQQSAWQQFRDENNRVFFVHSGLGVSTYAAPAGVEVGGPAAASSMKPSEWSAHTHGGKTFYFDAANGISTWKAPRHFQPQLGLSMQSSGAASGSSAPRSSSSQSTSLGAGGAAAAGGGGDESNDDAPSTSWFQQFAARYLYREAIKAPADYNRWLNIPFSVMVQLSIGSVYAWSLFNAPLCRQLGVVTPSSGDWALDAVVPVFSVCALTLGACTAGLGKWAERVGPRMVAGTAALCWGGGLTLSAIGCELHQLPLLYAGYGLLGGVGWGLGYISPVSTLLKWFPDRKGLAAGMALTAFGGGAMVATPLNEALLEYFFQAPTYLGAVDSVQLITQDGSRFVPQADGSLTEVVVASTRDVAQLHAELPAGVYEVGTGDSGVRNTFLALAALHTTSMLTGAAGQRVPPPGWSPPAVAGAAPSDAAEPIAPPRDALAASGNVDPDQVMRTPQFYLLWAAVAGNAIAGVSVISCAKTLMTDCFSSALPGVVTASFAAAYVAALSGANMAGRFGWSFASDFLGRKNTYFMFAAGIPTVLALPALTEWAATDPGMAPLVLFYGGTWLVVSFYGGVFSVLPAYLSDLFGQKHVGAIHGRLLTAWAAAAAGGPYLLAALRHRSYDKAVRELAAQVDPEHFQRAFGAPLSDLDTLLERKSVTIPHLMDIAPGGVMDPTPMLNNDTMYAMGGLLTVALACNAAIRPVDPRHYIENRRQVVDAEFKKV